MEIRAPWKQPAIKIGIDREIERSADVIRTAMNRADFEQLYIEFRVPIYRYCYGRLSNVQAAEDATQLVFTKALDRIHTCRIESFRGWIFTIAHNVTTDVIRGWRVTEPLETAESIVNNAVSPETHALQSADHAEIVRALDQLTDDQRDVINLRFSGASLADTAAILRTSEGAVKQLQRRGLIRLREILGNDTDRKAGQHA